MNQAVTAELERLGNTFTTATDALLAENAELKSRIEILEANGERPKGRIEDDEAREQKQYREAFMSMLRRPGDSHAKAQFDQVKADLEKKDITIGTGSQGGYALPKAIGDMVHQQMFDLNPFRRLVRVQAVGTSDYQELVAQADNSAGWVSETGSRSATNTPTFRNRKPTWGELYAYLQVSNWALEDVFFDTGSFLADATARLFAATEGTAIVSGNGSARPTGFLNTTTVTTDDTASPIRSHEAIEYIASAASPVAVSYDGLIDVMTALHEGYLASPQCAWVMHRSTLADVQKLKDTTGQPLWQPSVQMGVPSMLLGHPVYTSAAMPTGAGNDVLAFGDWNSAYLLATRSTIQVTIDQVTNPGYTRFYIRQRVGGILKDNNAIKTLKLV